MNDQEPAPHKKPRPIKWVWSAFGIGIALIPVACAADYFDARVEALSNDIATVGVHTSGLSSIVIIFMAGAVKQDRQAKSKALGRTERQALADTPVTNSVDATSDEAELLSLANEVLDDTRAVLEANAADSVAKCEDVST